MNEIYLWYGVQGSGVLCLCWIAWNLHRIADALVSINITKED